MLDIKTTAIAVCAVVGILTFAFYKTYDIGYDNGVEYMKTEVEKLNTAWETKVSSSQKEHDDKVKEIYISHTHSISELKKQIEVLTTDKIKTETVLKQYKTEGYVPNGFVLWHDRASQGNRLDVMVGENVGTTSKYTFNDVMMVIGNNYNKYNVCKSKLDSLQEIVKDYIEKQKVMVIYEKTM